MFLFICENHGSKKRKFGFTSFFYHFSISEQKWNMYLILSSLERLCLPFPPLSILSPVFATSGS